MASKTECPRCGGVSANLVHGVCRACYMRDYHQRRTAAAVTKCPNCGGISANFVHGVCRACYMRDYHQRRTAAAVTDKQGVFGTLTLIDDSEGQRLCVECKAPSVYARGRCLECYMRDRQRQRRPLCVECGESAVYARGRCQNCYKRDRQNRQGQRRCVECAELGIYARGLCQNCYLRDRRRHHRMKFGACVVCGVSFQSVRRDALYCSPGCRQKAHRVGKAQFFGMAASAGERGAVQPAIETQDATPAARIEVQTQVVAGFDRRLGQVDSTIGEAAKRGPINAVLSAVDGQRKSRQVPAGGRREASTLAALKAERASLAAKGRQVETEAAPIRYVADLVGAETNNEWALRWLLALIMLCFDPPARAHRAAASFEPLNFRD
jgi:ribosomal protein L32